MRRIEFEVAGELPPKKDGAKSMWNDGTQEPRLVELRRKARAEFAKKEDRRPFTRNIQLTLHLKVGEGFLRERSQDPNNFGDLDNLVGGVCDGLQRPPSEDERFFPSFCAIENDSEVVKIVATKRLESGYHCRYTIALKIEGGDLQL